MIIVYLSWGDETKSLGRPRQPEFVGQRIGDERAAERGLHRSTEGASWVFRVLVAHAREETKQGQGKNHQKGAKVLLQGQE